MPDQRHESHHKICNLRYERFANNIFATKGLSLSEKFSE